MRLGSRVRRARRHIATGLTLGLLGMVALGCASAMSPTSATSALAGDTTISLAPTTTEVATTATSSVSTTVTTSAATPSTTTQPATTLEYRNTQYGFSFSLPVNWQGYSIVVVKWEGYPVDGNAPKVEGPEILIRHPLWTSANPRQDIPIMVFTPGQWQLIQQEKLAVGAAPIGPSELGRNADYVFALPARYNYAFPTGYEEVERILEGKPFQTF